MLPDAAAEPLPFSRHCHCRSRVAATMSTKNDITMVQRWICRRCGEDEQDNYHSRIDLGPDNNVADAVSCLEGAGYELEKIVGGIMLWLKASVVLAMLPTVGLKRVTLHLRTLDLLKLPPPLSVPLE